MSERSGSPWWYRCRSLLFFAIFALGFYGGWLAWERLKGGRYESAYAWIARTTGANAHGVLWLASALVLLGFAVRLWGSSYLHANVVWNRNALDDRLIVDGPFRFIRNPLYFGNVLQAVGIGLLACPYGFAFIVVASVIFTAMLAAHEAQLMRERYGAVYERFRASVPAMVPRLTPAKVQGSVLGSPSVASGIRSELLSLGFVVGMAGMAIDGARAFPFFGACWVGGWILQNILRARAEPEPG